MKKLTLIALSLILFSGLVCSLVWAETQKELFDRGVVRLKDNQFQEAVDAFTQLVSIAPENPDAYKNRGVAYMKLGEYDLAIQDFEKTRQILPDMKGLYSNLGVAWYYKGEYTKAIENYNKEIELTPDNYYAFFNRAICRAELNELTPGLEDVNRAIALSPDFYLAHCLRGDLLVKMGKDSLAREAYQRAVEIDPDLDYAKEQLASLPEPLQPPPPEPEPAAAPSSHLVEKGIPQAEDIDTPSSVEEQDPLPESNAAATAQSAPAATVTTDTSEPSQADTGATFEPDRADDTYAWELQAGAYQEEKNALDMEKILKDRGYVTRILELTRPSGKHWYLVRTGGFDNRNTANAAKKEIIAKQGMDVIVRPWGKF